MFYIISLSLSSCTFMHAVNQLNKSINQSNNKLAQLTSGTEQSGVARLVAVRLTFVLCRQTNEITHQNMLT